MLLISILSLTYFIKFQGDINIPILHIAEVTARELERKNITKVALLGTKYTMEEDFYKSKLIENGIKVLVADKEDIETVNKIIYDELCVGIISEHSREIYLSIIDKLNKKGAQGVILGCTEIGLLVQQRDTKTPLFDATLINEENAALYSIE